MQRERALAANYNSINMQLQDRRKELQTLQQVSESARAVACMSHACPANAPLAPCELHPSLTHTTPPLPPAPRFPPTPDRSCSCPA